MDTWKRLRLLICIVVMLGMLVFGGVTRLLLGVPDAPYGYIEGPWFKIPRSIDPFQALSFAYEGAPEPMFPINFYPASDGTRPARPLDTPQGERQ